MNRFLKYFLPVVLLIAAIALLFLNSELALTYYSPAASIKADVNELLLSPSNEQLLAVQVSNIGRTAWIPNEASNTALSYRIYDEESKTMVYEGERIPVPYAVKPEDRVELNLTITAPEKPGQYIVVIDMVQEGVAWFEDRGSEPLKIKLEVSKGL
jgi:hypothetical protein